MTKPNTFYLHKCDKYSALHFLQVVNASSFLLHISLHPDSVKLRYLNI